MGELKQRMAAPPATATDTEIEPAKAQASEPPAHAAGNMRPAAAPAKVKPALRGTVHNYAAFVALAMGCMLMLDAHGTKAKLGCLVHTIATTTMFGVSAAYHRPTWAPEARARMRKLDHAAIFLLIAGTNTPLALLGLPPAAATRLLATVWAGALAGMLQPVLLPTAPKALKAAIYVALGWTALPYAGQIKAALGPVGVWLVVGGGVVYSVGALVYALRRPDPFPASFGYHEIFHVLVTLAALMHFAAVYRVVHTHAATQG